MTKKVNLLLFAFLLIFPIESKCAEDDDKRVYSEELTIKGIKHTATTGAVWFGSKMCRNWARDLTAKAVVNVKHDNFVFDSLFGSELRSKGYDAIQPAGEKGYQYGAALAAFCTPILCDVGYSCFKTLRPYWDGKVPEKLKPTKVDKILTVSTFAAVIISPIIIYFTYFYNNKNDSNDKLK